MNAAALALRPKGGKRDCRRLLDGPVSSTWRSSRRAWCLGHAALAPVVTLGCRRGRWAVLAIRPRYDQSPLMLWWIIGVWLASGAVLPVFVLLSMAYSTA